MNRYDLVIRGGTVVTAAVCLVSDICDRAPLIGGHHLGETNHRSALLAE